MFVKNLEVSAKTVVRICFGGFLFAMLWRLGLEVGTWISVIISSLIGPLLGQ